MDITKESPTIVSLCSGYGGIELGLGRVFGELSVLAHVEIEAFAVANLVNKMEAGLMAPAPIWTDVKTLNAGLFRGHVDILTGGYPCQPFSAAGKRQGADDPRHLWPHIRTIIRDCQPEYCFFENVEGHISLGLSTVIADLEEDGYRTTWGIFSAEECGAPHRRKRVFILANRSSEGFQGLRQRSRQERREAPTGYAGGCSQVWPSRPGQPQHEWEAPRVVGNTKHNGHATTENRGSVGKEQEKGRLSESSGRREQATDNWQVESPMGGKPDGSSDWLDYAELCDNRTDELRLLGNGVVPATAELAWRTLYKRLNK